MSNTTAVTARTSQMTADTWYQIWNIKILYSENIQLKQLHIIVKTA